MDLEVQKPVDIEVESDPIATAENATSTTQNVQEQGLDAETRRNQRYDKATIRALNRQKISDRLDVSDDRMDDVSLVQLANANYLRELNKFNVSF